MSKKNEKVLVKVFDLIDSGNYGGAETQLSTLPTSWDDAQAARSLLLLRRGKKLEATALAEGLVENDFVLKGTTGHAIDAVAHVLQQISSHKLLIKAYEQTLTLMDPNSPSSTPLQANLFNAMLMAGEYAAAQRAGIALFKKTKDDTFMVRSVMCNLCLLRDVTDPEAMLVKLTLRQLEGLVAKKSVPPEVAGMYLFVLRKIDSMKAIEWVCGEQSTKLGLPSARYSKLFELAAAQEGGLPRLRNVVAKCAWEGDSDNWNYFTQYFNTVAPSGAADTSVEVAFDISSILGSKQQEQSGPIKADTADDVVALCKSLQAIELKRNDPGKMKRGPFLAELFVNKGTPQCAAPLKEYVRLFGRKACCFLDVAMVCADISDTKLIDELVAVCEKESKDAVVGRNYYLLSRKLPMLKWAAGEAIPNAEELMISDVSDHRKRASEFEGLEWSEEGPMDGLLITAANIAAREAMRATDPAEEKSWLIRGLQCFAGMDRRKNNPGVLVLAVLLSQRLGLGFAPDFHQLDFKSIQFMTMGHVGYWPLMSSRLIANIRAYSEHATRYFGGLQREADAMKWKVFQHCTWSKTHEIDAFEAKLLCCLPRRELTLVQTLLHIQKCQTQKFVIEHIRTSFAHFSQLENLALVDDVVKATSINEDEMFLTAFLIDKPNSASSKKVADYLFNRVDKDQRCAVVSLCASAFAVLYDASGVELSKQVKVPKGAPPPPVDSLLAKWGVSGATIKDAGARSKGALGAIDWAPVISSSSDIVAALVARTDIAPHGEELVSRIKEVGVSLQALTGADASWSLVFPFGWFFSALIGLLPASPTTHSITGALNTQLFVPVAARLEAQMSAADKSETLAAFLEAAGHSATPSEALPTAELLVELKKGFAISCKSLQAEFKEMSAEISSNLRRRK